MAMKILIVRHGDPDYERDCLTAKGRREAEMLAQELSKMEIAAFYQSPLGRARETALYTLRKMNRTAKTLAWLQEFKVTIDRPDVEGLSSICWDWLPDDWTQRPALFGYDTWYKDPIMAAGGAQKRYRWVAQGFESVLAEHGYVFNGRTFDVKQNNHDTIVFFCHLGVQCVMLGHIMHISPMILWQNTAVAPTSVTVLNSEERSKGTAVFRMSRMGDISHLYKNGEEPSLSARFCECFEDDTRHV
jgi:probable phosphoglycerate mutase